MTPSLRSSLLVLTLPAFACSEDLPVFGEKAWVGDHLEIWTTEDAQVCGGSFDALDQHADEEPGLYTVVFDAGEGTDARLVGCDNDVCGSGFNDPNNFVALFRGQPVPVEFEAGRFGFRVSRALDAPPDDFAVRVLQGWTGE